MRLVLMVFGIEDSLTGQLAWHFTSTVSLLYSTDFKYRAFGKEAITTYGFTDDLSVM
jgi:hypothetical protein